MTNHSENLKNLFLYNEKFMANQLSEYRWKSHIILHFPDDSAYDFQQIVAFRDEFVRLLLSLQTSKLRYYFATIEGGLNFASKPHIHILVTFKVDDKLIRSLWLNKVLKLAELESEKSTKVCPCEKNQNITDYVCKWLGAQYILFRSRGYPNSVTVYFISSYIQNKIEKNIANILTRLEELERETEQKQIDLFTDNRIFDKKFDELAFYKRENSFLRNYVFVQNKLKLLDWYKASAKIWENILVNKKLFKYLDPIFVEILRDLLNENKKLGYSKQFLKVAYAIVPYILSAQPASHYKFYAGVASFLFSDKFHAMYKKDTSDEIYKHFRLYLKQLDKENTVAYYELGRGLLEPFLHIYNDPDSFFTFEFIDVPNSASENLAFTWEKKGFERTIFINWPSAEKLNQTKFGKNLRRFIEKYCLTQQLPMVYAPKNWELPTEKNLEFNCSGGYLLNSQSLNFTLFSTQQSHEFKIQSPAIRDSLNHLQERPFIINSDLLEFIQANRNSVYLENQIDYEESKKIINSHKNLLKAIDQTISEKKFKKKLMFEEYKKKERAAVIVSRYTNQQKALTDIDTIKSKLIQFNKLYQTPCFVWFPYGLDFRGRVDPHAFANPMSSKLIRSLLLHPYPVPFDLKLFKFYAYKCFRNDYVSTTSGAEKFDTLNLSEKMLNFRTDKSIFLDAHESELMLSCCFEWEKFMIYSKKNNPQNYVSRFMMMRDATASGWQIVSMLLNYGSYQRHLNLRPQLSTSLDEDTENLEKSPVSFYRSMFKEFIQTDFGKEMCTEEYFQSQDFLDFLHLNYKEQFLEGQTDMEVIAFVFGPLFKKFLMKGIYGGTQHTFIRDVDKFLNQINFPEKLLFKFSAKLKKNLWAWFKKTPAGIYSEILYDIAKFALDRNGIVFEWSLKLGTFVTQRYDRQKEARVMREPLFLVGKDLPARHFTYGYFDRELPDKRKMKTAFPPNLIHSLDAAIIHSFSLVLREEFPELSFQVTHDCVLFPLLFEDLITTQIKHTYYDIFFKHSRVDAENKKGLFQVILDQLFEQLYLYTNPGNPFSRKDIDKLRADIDEKFAKFEKSDGYTTFIPDELLKKLTCVVY